MRLKDGVILQEMGETYIAYDNKTSTIHELNESALFILKRIKNGNTKGEVIKAIVSDFGIDESEAQSDYDNFVELLKENKLVSER